jgi:arylsulfatase A-like enzyme
MSDQPSAGPETILFVLTDQMRADCVGAFGHPVVRTPTLDALVADGIGFRRVVTQAPLCVPARMCLFTGRYVHQTGCLNNGRGLWPETDNFVRRLRDAGRRTACRGKLHLFWRHDNELLMSDPMLRRFGFDDPMETTGKASQGRLRASAYTEFLRSRGRLEAHWKWLWEIVRHRPVGVSFGPSILDEDEQMDGWIMDRGRDYVNAHLHDDRPFFAWVGPEGPHDPFDPPGDWATMYDPDAVDPPLRRLSEDPLARQRGEKGREKDADDALLRRMRALYYGNISFIDHKLGQIVDDLKRAGAYDRTWIVFASDHGEMLGDFHCTTKTLFHRQSVEVPLIIKPPARLAKAPRGQVSDALVELIDLGATFLDIAGGELPGDRGRSLMPILTGETDPAAHRDVVRSQVNANHMVQTADRKLIYRTEDPRGLEAGHELLSFFDLEADPRELHNGLDDRRAEAEAFFAEHEPGFYRETTDHLPPQWKDEAPHQHWGRNPLLDALDDV